MANGNERWNSRANRGVVAAWRAVHTTSGSSCCAHSVATPRAYEELVRPHQEIAFRVAYVITRNAADAEDAVQDALVKAWRALGRFRAGEPLRPWLLRIAANEARNRRRSAGRRERLALRAAAPGGGGPLPRGGRCSRGAARAAARRARRLCRRRRARCSPAATCSSSPRRRPRPRSTSRRGTVKSRSARALERLKEAYGPRA